MAVDEIELALASNEIYEQSAMTCLASFRNRATKSAEVPTNVYWRLDDIQDCEIQGWTSVTPASELTIFITSQLNHVGNFTRGYERRVLSVASDYGLATQLVESTSYEVKNIAGIS
jgi:hypothetical protein